MAITAGGVGSGLDVAGIVSQLMALERRPVNDLQSRGRVYESQLSAYGRLRSSLSSFQSAMEGLGSLDKFKVFSSSSSDEDVLSASADGSAAAGIYSLEVSRLAQNHKMGSAEIDKADVFSGNLQITVDGKSLTIDTSGLTLSGIRDAINTDSDNPGLTATILNTGGDNQRLILTSDESGTAKSISINETLVTNTTSAVALGLDTINRNELGELISTAQLDATFKVDGYDLTSASNTVSGVIDGISINLKGIGNSTLSLARDDAEVKKSVQSFVDAYNELHSTLDSLSTNELAGDSTIRSIQGAIRNVFNSAPAGLTGPFQALINVGINSDARTGSLSLDSSALEDALAIDFQSVAELFAHDDQGFAFRLADIADRMLDDGNIVDVREEGLESRIRRVEDDILSWEARLELKETALRAQFASLDALIGSLQSTSAFLAQNLAQQ